MRLRLDIAYDGTDFHGWAVQKDPQLRTVQGELEKTLSMVLREPITLTVAGRTDAGVHATGQVAHFIVTPEALGQRSIAGDPQRLVRRLARLLDDGVIVRSITEVPESFDARFSALTRSYTYRVTTDPAGALPTRARDTAAWPKPVDLGAMNAAASALVGLHDFAAFCRVKPNATTIRELQSFTWHDVSTPSEPHLYEARVTADAFCWSMVRSLVGGCLAVGEGRRDVSIIADLLDMDTRSSEIPVAPAHGLTLTHVAYPAEKDLATRADATRARRSGTNDTIK